MPEGKPVLLSERRTAERYSVCTRTLLRWDEMPDLHFPPVIMINRRRYREVAALDRWDKATARESIARRVREHEEARAE